MPRAQGLRLDDDWDGDDWFGEEDFLDDDDLLPRPEADEYEDEDEEDWARFDKDDDLHAWEELSAKEEARRELRESEPELIQEDMERQAWRRSLSRKWYYWEIYLLQHPQRSWKHHRRIRHEWQRPLKWRREHRRAARAFARELNQRAMAAAMGELRPYWDLPAPKYKI